VVSWLGPVLVMGWADPWTGAGLRPGKSLFPIFFSSIPFLFVLFQVSILGILTNI
jgi:hypothetical protein